MGVFNNPAFHFVNLTKPLVLFFYQKGIFTMTDSVSPDYELEMLKNTRYNYNSLTDKLIKIVDKNEKDYNSIVNQYIEYLKNKFKDLEFNPKLELVEKKFIEKIEKFNT